MPHRKLAALFLIACAALWSSCHKAGAVTPDFDSDMVRLEEYLSGAVTVRGVDGDDNGIKEEDQLGMLSAILLGGSGVSCLNAAMVTEIQNGFQANLAPVEAELTVDIGSQGTVSLVGELKSIDQATGQGLQNVLAGLLAVGDDSTISYINGLADQLIVKLLTGTPEEDSIPNVQNQINFVAAAFNTYGGASFGDTNYLGPNGDVDGDLTSNLNEYTGKTREQWLSDNCITPPLRLKTYSKGGSSLTGLSKTFQAQVAGGTGSYTFAWQKGTPGSSTLLTVNDTYTIDFLKTSDSGKYFCIVDDGVSTLSLPVLNLTVTFVGLFISQGLQNTNRVVGDPTTLTVVAQGGSPGPYAYTWRKNGDVIPTATTNQLTFANVALTDAGTYSVTVTSNGGPDAKTSGPITLSVFSSLPPLSITAQPQDADVTVDTNYTLSVTVTGGSSAYTYQWFKDSNAIPGATGRQLRFLPIKFVNQGVYYCHIVDGSASVSPIDSNPANINVVLSALSFTQQPPANITVAAGNPASFTVAATGGSGQYAYQWNKGGNPIPTAPNSPTYEILSTVGADEGEYTCTVIDASGGGLLPITSNPSTLHVVVPQPLVVDAQPQNQSGYVGDQVILSVGVSGGSNSFHYAWFHNGNPVGTDDASLFINPATLGDAGAYYCAVSDANIQGFNINSNTAQVTVVPHVSISVHPADVTVYTGAPLALSVTAAGGQPPLQYQWFKGLTALNGETASTLDLDAAELAEAGAYSVQVSDALTDDVMSLQADVVVNLIETPIVPADFDIAMFAAEVVPPTSSPNFANGTGSIRRKGSTSAGGAIVHVSLTHSIGATVPGENPLNLLLNEGAAGHNGDTLGNFNNTQFLVDAEIEVTEEQASVILAGNSYLLFTSSSNPNGDIRGQVLPNIVLTRKFTADIGQDGAISLSELLRVIQLYNLDSLHCAPGSEDGYDPGPGDQSCAPHTSDYKPVDWAISLSELLRLIQIYNSAGGQYHPCDAGEDGFCPGPA